MHSFVNSTQELFRRIRDEVEYDGEIMRGQRGIAVRRVQEWLNLRNIGLVPDGDFGGVTERSVRIFQNRHHLAEDGVVGRETFETLVSPMISVLSRHVAGEGDVTQTIVAIANRHLAVHPREIGGQNKGPWVRLYMDGHEGPPYAWCAGFVSFLMRQACEALDAAKPIAGSWSCDSLAAQAREKGRFLAEGDAAPETVRSGSLFLVRRTSTDWTHVGIVTETFDTAFSTIEGNTNDEGSREGFEVCARLRGYKNKDFVLMGS